MGTKFRLGSLKFKSPFRRPGHRWEDLKKIELEGVDWIHLVQDRNHLQSAMSTVMNLCAKKGEEFPD
jgi:hypothetical protein